MLTDGLDVKNMSGEYDRESKDYEDKIYDSVYGILHRVKSGELNRLTWGSIAGHYGGLLNNVCQTAQSERDAGGVSGASPFDKRTANTKKPKYRQFNVIPGKDGSTSNEQDTLEADGYFPYQDLSEMDEFLKDFDKYLSSVYDKTYHEDQVPGLTIPKLLLIMLENPNINQKELINVVGLTDKINRSGQMSNLLKKIRMGVQGMEGFGKVLRHRPDDLIRIVKKYVNKFERERRKR